MKRKRLLIDIDEVIGDFQTPLFDTFYRLYGRRLSPYDFDVWNIFDALPKEQCEALSLEMAKPGYCKAIPPAPGAIDAISILRQYVDIYPVSNPFSSPTWVYERYEWLQKHFGFKRNKIIFTEAKFLISGDALLDDNPKNVTSWLEEHPDKLGMLWHIPNTRKMTEYDYLRVTSWEKVITLMKSLANP